MMQWRVVDRDLNFGGCVPPLACPRAEVPRSEGLSAAVLAANPLREPFTAGHEVELFVHGGDERIEAGREVLKAFAWHEPTSKGINDRRRVRDRGHHRPSLGW